jgi:pectate lyase
LVVAGVVLLAPLAAASPPAVAAGAGPIGFAAVDALGQNGTTGGAGGPVVTVTTAAQLIDYAARTGPYVIQVSGTITLPTGRSDGMYPVTSDKTIVGLGSTARIEHGGLTIGLPVDDDVTTVPANAVHNVIIRNLSFSGATDDAINVQMFSHHLWIDHNDLCCGDDGLVDIKRGSDYATVSWNRTHDHDRRSCSGTTTTTPPRTSGTCGSRTTTTSSTAPTSATRGSGSGIRCTCSTTTAATPATASSRR